MRINEFDSDVKYKKGLLNTQTDALSRLRSSRRIVIPADVEIPTSPLYFSKASSDPDDAADIDVRLAATIATIPLLLPITSKDVHLEMRCDVLFCTIRILLGKGVMEQFVH